MNRINFKKVKETLCSALGTIEMFVMAIIVIGLAFMWYNSTQPKNVSQITTYDTYLTHQERLLFLPLAERRKRCEKRVDCRTLAEAIVYEARGESELGRAAVGHVIMNRVNADQWSDTVKGVVYQPKQFSYLNKNAKRQIPPTQKDWDNGYQMAFEILNGMVDSPVADATHYHTPSVNPKWAKKLEYVVTIDNHIFYK